MNVSKRYDMAPHFTKFKEVLHELFMMDQADLDFGIYRIMNQKRAEINDYLDNKLKSEVERYLDEFSGKTRSNLENEIAKLAESLTDAGVSLESSSKYNDLKKQLEGISSKEELEENVYSHLTTFFKRYYDKGDFISLRRYKKDVYALPYDGEEVKLYWANSDQYYIKSSEYFRKYSFNLYNGKKVSFNLVEASTEQNNNKIHSDKERRFALYKEKPLEEVDGELKIYFTYEPTDKKVFQKELTRIAFQTLTPMIPQDFYDLFTKKPSEKAPDRTLLEKHLNDYVAKNTFDYFIHKDLGAFLTRELDFYIKNEILYIDDLEYDDENRLFRQLSVVKTIKKIGHNIIQFLASLEDFQKKLWLKKKFVVENNYCITLDRVPEEFHAEIAANDSQREEWIKLFAIDEIGADKRKPSGLQTAYSNPLSIEFLKRNPYLVLDTAFFDDDFKHKLIGSIGNIDENTDGLLISSENFQALNLLQEKYREQIKCVYIDPPYNAKSSEIAYKNSFKHSSWLSLMDNRINMGKNLMSSNASMVIAIDENEKDRLSIMLEAQMPNKDIVSVTVIHNPRGIQGNNFSYNNDYAIFCIPPVKCLTEIPRNKKDWTYSNLRNWGGESLRADAKNCFYPIIIREGKIVGKGEVPDDSYHPSSQTEIKGDGEMWVWPIDGQGIERKWRYAYQTIDTIIDTLRMRDSKDRKEIELADNTDKVKTTWNAKRYDASVYGTQLLGNMFNTKKFDFPKSVYTVQDTASIITEKDDLVVDFFAGSGTTGHAVINLNREDKGKRKYILVEMGEYFDTVTKPRIQKVIYSKDWKNGKPVSRQGSSHCFKYIRLESYEDTLNNLALRTNDFAQALNENNGAMKESFLLSYMLDTETKGSLFSTEWFADPFNFQLNITRKNELRREKIDLVDTFNYLIGLNVHSITYPVDGVCIVTGITRRGEKTFILWRDTNKIPNDKLNSIVEKLDINPRDNEFDRIYCNGNNNLENIRREGQTWKVILTEQEFAKLMFEIE